MSFKKSFRTGAFLSAAAALAAGAALISCAEITGEKPDLSSAVLNLSLNKQGCSIDYRETFASYFNQSRPLSDEEKAAGERRRAAAFSCLRAALQRINEQARGERDDSFSQEEIIALLKDPAFQERLTDAGFKNVPSFMESLTKDPARLFKIKNFLINAMAWFPENFSSERMCAVSRNRLYKAEIEILERSLISVKEWLTSVNQTTETVYENFLKNSREFAEEGGEGADVVSSYLSLEPGANALNSGNPAAAEGSLPFSARFRIRKSFFQNDQAIKFLLPALVSGFKESAPALSEDFERLSLSLTAEEPSVAAAAPILWPPPDDASADAVKKLRDAAAVITENNQLNGSVFLAKSDLLLLTAAAALADKFLEAYDKDGDGLISKEDFDKSAPCLEDFLAPLFKGNREAFYYFVEFQEDASKNGLSFYLNKWTGDEDFALGRADLTKMLSVLTAGLFPYKWFLKQDEKEEELQQILLKLQNESVARP